MNSNELDEFIERSTEEMLQQVDAELNHLESTLTEVPEMMKYSEVEKQIKKLGLEITRRMFTSYIQMGLLPEGMKKNDKLTIYSHNHVKLYYFVSRLKGYFDLDSIKQIIKRMKIKDNQDVLKQIKELFMLQKQLQQILAYLLKIYVEEQEVDVEVKDIDLYKLWIQLAVGVSSLDAVKGYIGVRE